MALSPFDGINGTIGQVSFSGGGTGKPWIAAFKILGGPRPNNEDLEPNTPTPPPPQADPGFNGDPHFKTWKNEHFEYHGLCDLFDILELQGTPNKLTQDIHYWYNYEYQGDITNFAGLFPVTLTPDRTRIEIDLDYVYPGQSISLSAYKEFVKVSSGTNASREAFGNTVGMLGNFTTGKTLARDGSTALQDVTELGHEWQVLPSDHRLFREPSNPQFPATCLDPEDPQGQRRRRLEESDLTEEQAEEACAISVMDELDRKDCVNDILATQDMGMVGAY